MRRRKQENISAKDMQDTTWLESWAILANLKKQLHFQHIVFLQDLAIKNTLKMLP